MVSSILVFANFFKTGFLIASRENICRPTVAESEAVWRAGL